MANDTLEMYIMKYTFKGETNSATSDVALRSITHSFCNQRTDSDKWVGNLVAKHMYKIINSESITIQEVAFLDGGRYTLRSFLEKPKKYSLISKGLEASQHEAAGRKSFTWSNIKKHHLQRSDEMQHLNVYMYVYRHWSSTGTTTP